jgi:hypothetical protein
MVDLDWSKRAMESIPLSSEDQMEKGRLISFAEAGAKV